jgi:transposase-like protein
MFGFYTTSALFFCRAGLIAAVTGFSIERVNQEIKRRTRFARLFPNEASRLRLVTALLAKISEEWESGKIHLNMETTSQPSV